MAKYSAKYALARAQILWGALISELANLPAEYNGFTDKEREILNSLYESSQRDMSVLENCFPLEITYEGSKIAD